MSNELIISTAQLPDYIREIGGYVDEGLAGGIAPRAPKFGITIDKAFTVTYEGNATILQGADGYPVREVIGVIVAASETLTKAWYEAAYEAGSVEAPDCFSNDGKVPAPGVAQPQHTNCAGCPKNAFGSHPVTGRGKACVDRKMIVMVTQAEPDRLLTFNVPTMSLQALSKLASDLKQANIALQSVAVKFSFDMSKTYSVVKIGTVGFLDKGSFLKYKNMADSDEVRSMLREIDYDAPTAPEPVVPANQINFGGAQGGTTNEQTQQATPDQQQTRQAAPLESNQAAGAPAPARRTRRTKAEMDAARAAEAQAAQGGANLTLVQNHDPVDNPPEDNVVATQTQQSEPVNTGGAPDILNLLNKWKNG